VILPGDTPTKAELSWLAPGGSGIVRDCHRMIQESVEREVRSVVEQALARRTRASHNRGRSNSRIAAYVLMPRETEGAPVLTR
jgi:hypothetical protein